MLFERPPNRFRPGDTVVVKTMRQLEEENKDLKKISLTVPGSICVRVRDGPSHRTAGMWVTPPMTDFCGKEAVVLFATSSGTYQLDLCPEFLFPESMLEKDTLRGIGAVSDDELAVFLR